MRLESGTVQLIVPHLGNVAPPVRLHPKLPLLASHVSTSPVLFAPLGLGPCPNNQNGTPKPSNVYHAAVNVRVALSPLSNTWVSMPSPPCAGSNQLELM